LSVCQEARNRPESEREAFLAQACGDDESLRSEIRSLLRQQISPELPPSNHPSLAVHSGVDDSAALVIGQRLGAYDIKALLGVGGMGEVYRARNLRLGRDVALKLLPSKAARDDDRIARLEREARVLAALNHPNIAAIYGIEESEGVRALVLELVEGESLAERLRTRGALSLDDALAIASQIGTALEAAHGRGIIHRDLKPANVQITPNGTVKVLDFGLAKAMASDPAVPSLSRAYDHGFSSAGSFRSLRIHESRTGARRGGGPTRGYLGLRMCAL
jgi:serine/threonine-protein kinase